MKALSLTARAFFIMALPVFLITSTVRLETNSLRLYEYGFGKYEVSASSGLSPAELHEAGLALKNYLNSQDELANPTFTIQGQERSLFNEREVAHLRDVKGLLQLLYFFQALALLYIMGYIGVGFWLRRWEFVPTLGSSLFGGSILAGILVLAVGLAAVLSFDRLFYNFHVFSFSNDLWRLDPTQDYLITMFPQGFWRDATLILGVATLVEAALLGGVGRGLTKLKIAHSSSSSRPSKPSRKSRSRR